MNNDVKKCECPSDCACECPCDRIWIGTWNWARCGKCDHYISVDYALSFVSPEQRKAYLNQDMKVWIPGGKCTEERVK